MTLQEAVEEMVRDLVRRAGGLLVAEMTLVLALCAVAGGLFAFVEVMEEVTEGESHGFDTAILRAFRSTADPAVPIGPDWLRVAFQEITSLGGTTVLALITLLAIAYLLIDRKPAAAVLVAVAIGGGTLVSTVLKALIGRTRPDVVAHLVEVQTASFPSGHAMMSAVTYLTLGALLARVEPQRELKAYFLGVAMILTLLIGLSRVYLGVHYPTDVLAGWSLGAAWAILCWAVAYVLQRHGDVEKPGEHAPPSDRSRRDEAVLR